MARLDILVADLLSAADGEITGRVRLQKMFYLLQQLGMSTDLGFRFHHYGPYSRNLDEAVETAKALQGVREEISYRAVDGAPFSIFRIDRRAPDSIGRLSFGRVQELARVLKDQPSTVLELAATIHWLRAIEKIADWQDELKRRKGRKAEGGRTEQALNLLNRLGLA